MVRPHDPDRVSDVTPAELSVLRLLWDDGPSTIRQLTERLYPEGKASSYATVQKLLERLETKTAVRRERASGGHIFHAAVDRETLLERRLRRVAEGLCEGSLVPLLSQLVQTQRLDASDRHHLRQLIDRLDDSSPRPDPESESDSDTPPDAAS